MISGIRPNVYRVDVESTQSGADLPGHCSGGNTVTVRTYFNASFCGAGNTKRLLVVDASIARRVWHGHVPQAHVAIVIVNSGIYGGSGGEVPVFSTHASAALIGIHELGHSFFNLADEYETPYINDNPDNYPNLTSKTERSEIKWADLIAPDTPVPTLRNNCPQTGDAFSHPVPAGTVGLYEGGGCIRAVMSSGPSVIASCVISLSTSSAPFVNGRFGRASFRSFGVIHLLRK